jgi:hypothetical protein
MSASPSDVIHARVHKISSQNKQVVDEENVVMTALATRAFHLPGYGYLSDWKHYVCNNHLIFGICCHHPLHPFTTKQRCLNLLGSALFGLAITNVIWLGYIYYDQDPNSLLLKVTFRGGSDAEDNFADLAADTSLSNYTRDTATNATNNFTGFNDFDDSPRPASSFEVFLPSPTDDDFTSETLTNTLSVTKGMVLLWTVGAGLHAVFDATIWYLSACACCLPGNRCEQLGWMRRMGSAFTLFVVLLVTALASFAVVLRASLTDHEEIDFSQSNSAGLLDDTIDVGEGFREAAENVGALEFVMGYFVEFVLALFVYSPLFMTLLFNGYLNCIGCGKIGKLGGRPFEMRVLEEQSQVERLKAIDRTVSSRNGVVPGSQCLNIKRLERGSCHTTRTNASSRSLRDSAHSMH